MPNPETTRPAQGHTPGPWGRSRRDEVRQDATAEWIADVGGRNFDETGANACLLASAPELLAALEELVAEWDIAHEDEDHRTGYTLDTPGIEWARAAILKATGGADA